MKNSIKTIIISGTPGTGKSTLAKKLSKFLHAKLLDVKEIITINNLKEKYDENRDTYEVDTAKLNKILLKKINEEKKSNSILVIESHLAHYLPTKYIDLCIITSCNLKILQTRLKKRKYSKEKVRENLDAEIFDICYTEAIQKHNKVIKIDTSKGIDLNTLNQIKNHITE